MTDPNTVTCPPVTAHALMQHVEAIVAMLPDDQRAAVLPHIAAIRCLAQADGRSLFELGYYRGMEYVTDEYLTAAKDKNPTGDCSAVLATLTDVRTRAAHIEASRALFTDRSATIA